MVQRHYDFLKSLAQIYIPALGTLYFTIATIWHIPFAEEVVGSLMAVDTFLGVILKVSTSKYTPPTDGNVFFDKSDPELGKYRLEIDEDSLEQIAGKDQLRLQVKQELPSLNFRGRRCLPKVSLLHESPACTVLAIVWTPGPGWTPLRSIRAWVMVLARITSPIMRARERNNRV